MTGIVNENVQVTHRAVGGESMHGFGTDLFNNPAIRLVDNRNYVNLFA